MTWRLGKVVRTVYLLYSITIFVLVQCGGEKSLEEKNDQSLAGFGMNGYLIAGEGHANALAVQRDRKILAVGSSGTGLFAVVRFLSNGLMDSTFGSTGAIEFSGDPNAPLGPEALAVAIDSQGRILVGGGSVSGTASYSLVRLNSDGSIDTSFGNNGYVLFTWKERRPSQFPQLQKIIPIGSNILVGGTCFNGDTGPSHCLNMIDDSGNAVTTFAENGKLTREGGLSDLKADASGNILVLAGGTRTVYGWWNYTYVYRYKPDGTLDSSFKGGGLQSGSPAFSLPCSPGALVVDSSGNVFFSGQLRIATATGAFLAKLLPNGDIDTSFGEGKGYYQFADIEPSSLMALQDNDKILLAGSSTGFIVNRINTDGSRDASFGTEGSASLIYSNNHYARALLVDPDGRILLAGLATVSPPSSDNYRSAFMMARWLSEGTPDKGN